MDSDDEFGLCSEDEEALALACENADASAKRKHDQTGTNIGPPSKKQLTDAFPRKSPLAVKVLNDQFGLKAFRLEQEAAIARLLEGGSAVVVFPTGGGKSLCYQVPAVAFAELDKLAGDRGPNDGGVTIVVSPLIALMKDQVDALLRRNIKAAVLNSSLSRESFLQVNDDLRNGRLKLLYCAPERLNNEGFVESIKSVRGGVRLVAVDEAHCVSEWGHSFRPDYLKVARFITELNAERVVCLTATATPKVARDICNSFGIDESGLFRTTMYRPNLRLLAEVSRNKQDYYPKLFKFLRENRGPTIIYVTIQKQSEFLAEDLQEQGFKAKAFHAGLPTEEKTNIQDQFMTQNDLIIVATIAFGMGIDKANIRNLIHCNIPSSVEEYSQQIGRAGRDGRPSICMFYMSPEDFYLRNVFTYGDLPSRDSVRRFLEHVFSPANVLLDVGDTFNTNHRSQAKDFDINLSPLSIMYAQLELQFGLIRATTPIYAKYEYETINARILMNDSSSEAVAIRSVAHKKTKWWEIDADSAATRGGVNRLDIIKKLNDWNDRGIILMKASGVQNVYRVEKKLPSTPQEIAEIVDRLYLEMVEREQQALQRTKEVVGLVTSKKCFSRSLAAYFGDGSEGMPDECGHCTWCETHRQVVLPKIPPEPPSPSAITAILRTCPWRDDPRFLARVAFGITSPRVTAEKLKSSAVFNSMPVCEFMELVSVFTEKCNEANQANPGNQANRMSRTNRTN
ncbi:ATP-dependent DNA helicase [Lepidopterella palustris CBS 459.81]|uniref:ATP-dependent DNA helicase n=1 Tax=Lepidopterella palustris CBS 459.81 TaxID=1314670 RepID=A0A8E2E6S6_9PEZI|nr:ATP-dependent DNA helicase [Lepidopterella palustris CBS 459.81]